MPNKPSTVPLSKPLNLRQQRFVQAFLDGGSAASAARRAGYSVRSSVSAGHQLMRNPRVAAAIEAERARRAAPLTREAAIEGLRAIASANVLDYVRPGPEGALELDLWRLERDRAGAVRELTVVEKTDPVSGAVTRTVGFKLADRSAALMKLLPMLRSAGESEAQTRSWEHGAGSVADMSVEQFGRFKALRAAMGRGGKGGGRAAPALSAVMDAFWDEELTHRISAAELAREEALAAREADLDALAEQLEREWEDLDADRRAVLARESAAARREAQQGLGTDGG